MRALLLLLAALALAVPVGATGCVPTTSSAHVDTDPAEVGAPVRLYVVSDGTWCPHCKSFWSVWVYEESNGIPGLQRQDEVMDDTCGGKIRGDTIHF